MVLPRAPQPVIRIVDASGNTVTSSSVNVVASIASGTGGTLSGTTTVAAVSGIATFTNLVITGTAGNFTLTFTPSSLTAVTSSSLAITAAVYAVGSTGPGGGKVFYYNASGFACGPSLNLTCNYLEAAPTSGTNAWTDNSYYRSVTSQAIGANAQGTAVGTGYKNTLAIIAQNNTADKAATISQAFRGPYNLTDWYLPSKDELNQMCKWQGGITGATLTTLSTRCPHYITLNSGTGAAGFRDSSYWSSSESVGGTTFGTGGAWLQFFRDGSQLDYGKNHDSPFRVRPVRAF